MHSDSCTGLRREPRRALSLVFMALALLAAGCPEGKVNEGAGDACVGAACASDTYRPIDDTVSDVGARDTGLCTPNPCGGCAALQGRPNDSCGSCGKLVCDGTDGLRCQEGAGNACGGCAALTTVPDDPCGTCGKYVCDGPDAVRCDDGASTNSCGGCNALSGVKDQACGDCGNGKWTCLSPNSIVCQNDTLNSCGGCTALSAREGDPCGACGGGVYDCDGTDALTCVGGDNTNLCGGCGQLVGTIGEACGDCLSGTLQCNGDGSALECAGASACDPCAPTGGADGNDTLATATPLGDYDDGDNGWMTHRDWLHSATDVDVFAAHVDDRALYSLNVVAELTDLSVDYDLCVFWERDDGGQSQVDCVDGAYSLMEGREGCCSQNADAAPEFVAFDDLAGGGGVDDSGTAYYVVVAYNVSGCYEYELAFGF